MRKNITVTSIAKYILALVKNSVAESDYENIKSVLTAENCDSIFGQILQIVMDEFHTNKLTLDEAVAKISKEYTNLELETLLGDFSQWEAFIHFCCEEAASDHTGIESVLAIAEFSKTIELDCAIFVMNKSALNYLVLAGMVPAHQELSSELIEIVDGYIDEDIVGELSASALINGVFNKK